MPEGPVFPNGAGRQPSLPSGHDPYEERSDRLEAEQRAARRRITARAAEIAAQPQPRTRVPFPTNPSLAGVIKVFLLVLIVAFVAGYLLSFVVSPHVNIPGLR